jgi:hypothetical protein
MQNGRSFMSPRITKLIRPVTLAAAAVFFHIGVASAGGSAGDVQQQMKELLTGTATAHFASQSAPRDSDTAPTRTVDSQEFVKQLLLGRSSRAESGKRSDVAGDSAKTQARELPVAYRDSQAAVRHVLLGQSHASDAS